MMSRAIEVFHKTKDRTTLVIVDSHIGYGPPTKQDTGAAHGEPLGEEEIRKTKQFYGWPEDAKILGPAGVREHFQERLGKRGRELTTAWAAKVKLYREKYADLTDQLIRSQDDDL